MAEWAVNSNMLAMSTTTPIMELVLERMPGGSLMPLLLQVTILAVVLQMEAASLSSWTSWR